MACLVVGIRLIRQLRKGIHRLAVQQNIDFHQLCRAHFDYFILKRRITAADAFEPVVKLKQHFRKRHFVGNLHPLLIEVVHVGLRPPLFDAEGDDIAEVFRRGDDIRFDIRLIRGSDFAFVGIFCRVVADYGFAAPQMEAIPHGRRRKDNRLVEFPFQPFLYNLQMEQPQKAAAEPMSERYRRIFFVGEACIV